MLFDWWVITPQVPGTRLRAWTQNFILKIKFWSEFHFGKCCCCGNVIWENKVPVLCGTMYQVLYTKNKKNQWGTSCQVPGTGLRARTQDFIYEKWSCGRTFILENEVLVGTSFRKMKFWSELHFVKRSSCVVWNHVPGTGCPEDVEHGKHGGRET